LVKTHLQLKQKIPFSTSLQASVRSSLFGRNIVFSTLFSFTPNPCYYTYYDGMLCIYVQAFILFLNLIRPEYMCVCIYIYIVYPVLASKLAPYLKYATVWYSTLLPSLNITRNLLRENALGCGYIFVYLFISEACFILGNMMQGMYSKVSLTRKHKRRQHVKAGSLCSVRQKLSQENYFTCQVHYFTYSNTCSIPPCC
jgi:hypothetical protein